MKVRLAILAAMLAASAWLATFPRYTVPQQPRPLAYRHDGGIGYTAGDIITTANGAVLKVSTLGGCGVGNPEQ